MPKIPVDIDSMVTDLPNMDEGIPYHGIIRSCALSETPDKKGQMFITKTLFEVIDPEEYKGRVVGLNYAPIVQSKPTSSMDLLFPRMIKAFKIPVDADGFDPQDAIGCEGDFTVRNDEYQGQTRAIIKDFLM